MCTLIVFVTFSRYGLCPVAAASSLMTSSTLLWLFLTSTWHRLRPHPAPRGREVGASRRPSKERFHRRQKRCRQIRWPETGSTSRIRTSSKSQRPRSSKLKPIYFSTKEFIKCQKKITTKQTKSRHVCTLCDCEDNHSFAIYSTILERC